MKFPITVYQNDHGTYLVECATIPGCKSEGATEEEALQHMSAAIKQHLQERHEKKLMLTIANRELDVHINI